MSNETANANCSHNCSWADMDNRDNLSNWDTDYPVNLFPIPVLTGITATCICLLIIGTAGNLMTVLIVSKFKDMRTTTNLYLSSMAFSDLLIFLCMPLDLYRIWRYRPWNFGDVLCKVFQFTSESCTYSTILNITALSVERYFAICFPLRAKVVVTKSRVKGVILIIWIVAFVSAGPIFVLVGVEHENGTDPWETNECKATDYAIRSGLLTIMVWVSSIFFFLPVFCLTVLYSLIGRKLWKRKKETIGPSMSSRDKSSKQTVKMLAVVVFAFVLCWLPFHVGRYLFSKSSEAGSLLMSQISQYCNLVSFVLFYLSAAINPILYNIMSKKYRVAACKLFGLKQAPRRTASTMKDESTPVWTESSVST
ncbi:Growth hormone secretagogue receptor type 1 [Acipenser ruthenus]|uniref:Growth hormone secretagogue receptor type 1 n=1 Tax=Acipenser ruthenus TaxID=7906 RepID=A0A444TZ52_ACIRT|nr:growth hormone secretagogue receptor type 1-like [Acipenser ruthenus]RXM28213.1 Growth hormone secretagogue receptor type 1 [Acipenser ruthenus]